MTVELSWRPKMVVARYSGFVSEAEFLGSVRIITTDPQFDDLQFAVGNFLAVTDHQIETRSAMEGMVVESVGAKQSNPNIRILVISSDEKIRRAFDNMRQIGGEDAYPIHIVTGMLEAKAWLEAQPILHEMPGSLTRSIYS